VDEHADLLRESATDVGNEERLGGMEAPPAIISVFWANSWRDVIAQLVSTGYADKTKGGGKLETGVSYLSDISKDATDRNRTSPVRVHRATSLNSVWSVQGIRSPRAMSF
jgi:glutamine synthetase